MSPNRWAVVAALCSAAATCLGGASAQAGTLKKADVEAMFPSPQLVGEQLAHLPVWPIFTLTGQGVVLQHHVFETVDLEPVAGYGGKPINVLVVLDRDGAFVQARLLSHMEPIFRSAEGTATLARFAEQYQGLTVQHQIQVLGPKAQRVVTPTTATLHGIVAGTVTANAIDRSVLEAAAQVAQAHADPAAAARQRAAGTSGADDRYQRTGFNGLVTAGLVQPWRVDNRALEAGFAQGPGARLDAEGLIRPGNAGIDLWLAWVGLPQAGRNLLEATRWREVRELREQGVPVLMVLDGSRYPLAQARPGRFGAALGLTQAGRRFELVALPLEQGLRMSGQHSGVAAGSVARFYRVAALADGTQVDPYAPMEFELDVWRRLRDSEPGAGGSGPVGQTQPERARTQLTRGFEIADARAYRPQREDPRWLPAWRQRAGELAVLGIALAVLTVALAAQRRLAATRARLARFRVAFLLFTLVFIGWWAQGQLTVVSLTALVEALVAGRSADFLLLDPMAVVLWAFTLVTLFVWGRGTFCGWLCPFGALQELVARAARLMGLAQRRLRVRTDAMLKAVKYGVLAALLGAATVSAAWTEWLVEVEPFKTSISLHFVRDGPYVAWALACIGLGLFVYRGYCRYLCPLGAALAIPVHVRERLKRWGWIPRREACGTPCQTCRHRCDYQAIAPSGKVDYAECFQCLDCVQLHDDVKSCLPLVLQAQGKVIPILPLAGPVPVAAHAGPAAGALQAREAAD